MLEENRIGEIFARDPARRISTVINIDEHDSQVVANEVEEYVVTDQIREVIRDIVDRILETRGGYGGDVCAWLAGFFGSGKSHLLKMLGYLLTDRKIQIGGVEGGETGTADYFQQKHGIGGANILAKELRTRALFLNMLAFDRTKDNDLSRYIYKALLKDLDLSEIDWVAEIELMLKQHGLLDKFKEYVEEKFGDSWDNIRRTEIRIRPTLIKGLTHVYPEIYTDPESTMKAIDDQREEFTMSPERLAQRLCDQAMVLDEDNGRMILLLDEVGLYVRGSPRDPSESGTDRLTELCSLAEKVKELGRGKVWILATAQEALEQIAPEMAGRRTQLEWIRDRFPIRQTLKTENVPKVVKTRLLEKNKATNGWAKLKEMYQGHEGQLALATLLENPAKDTEILSAGIEFDEFSESYPLLPYHIPLMIDIFSRLRARGRRAGLDPRELAGRERAVLSVVQSLLNTLREEEVGKIVTFDLVYDAIDDVLKSITSEYQSLIEEKIRPLGRANGLEVSKVAKTLLLLQQIGDTIPCTIHNIAALLYPSLGTDQAKHEDTIQNCLQKLVEHHWVTIEDGKYRFLSEIEVGIEEDIYTQPVRQPDKTKLAIKTTEDRYRQRLRRYNHRTIKLFDVHLWIDEGESTKNGHLNLKIYTPLASSDKNLTENTETLSLAGNDTIYWISNTNPIFSDKVQRILATDTVLAEREKKTHAREELALLDQYRRKNETEKDELGDILDSELRGGTLIFAGEKIPVDKKKSVEETYNQAMLTVFKEVFTQFDIAPTKVDQKTIATIVAWTGGPLPQICTELKLVDSEGIPTTSGPINQQILRYLDHYGKCSGAEMVKEFESPPYGWDESIIRLATALLSKMGNIEIKAEIILDPKSFNRAIIIPGRNITPEQRTEANKLLSDIFGVPGATTTELISQQVSDAVNTVIDGITETKSAKGYEYLSHQETIAALEDTLHKLREQETPAARILNLLDPQTQITLKKNMPLLRTIQYFEKQGKLTTYIQMLEFAKTPLIELNQELEKPSKFSDATKNQDPITGWDQLYDQYNKLRLEYRKRYLQHHKEIHAQAESEKTQLEKWGTSQGLGKKEVLETLKDLELYLCHAGEKGTYDDVNFRCQTCLRSLSTLRSQKDAISTTSRVKKKKLVHLIEEKKGHDKTQTQEKEFSGLGKMGELGEMVARIEEFATHWLGKKKKIRIRIEGKVLDGEKRKK